MSLAVSGANAASVVLSGGGTSGQAVQLQILSDITLTAKPGSSFGGYQFMISIPNAISSSSTVANNTSYFDLATTANPPLTYQTTSTGATLNLTHVQMTLHTTGTNALVVTYTGTNWPELLINNGENVTFKAGTITLNSFIGNLVLQNPGQTYDLTLANLSTFSENGYNQPSVGSNMTSVPEASTSIVAMLGMIGCALQRRRR